MTAEAGDRWAAMGPWRGRCVRRWGPANLKSLAWERGRKGQARSRWPLAIHRLSSVATEAAAAEQKAARYSSGSRAELGADMIWAGDTGPGAAGAGPEARREGGRCRRAAGRRGGAPDSDDRLGST